MRAILQQEYAHRHHGITPANHLNVAVTSYLLDNFGQVLTEGTPLLRLGKPEDIAGTALFLASPAASWMTTLTLDGGTVVAMPAFRDLAKL